MSSKVPVCARPIKALKLTPESCSVTTCGIVLAAGANFQALTVSAFWCSLAPSRYAAEREIRMLAGPNRVRILRFVAGLALGSATSWVVLRGGFALLQVVWPDYALADPEKAYTLTMLFARLIIFSAMIAATAGVATLVAGDKRVAWVAGGLILAVSLPPHLYPGYVWDDYPVWYHIVYLLSILPIAAFGGQLVRRLYPGALLVDSAAQHLSGPRLSRGTRPSCARSDGPP